MIVYTAMENAESFIHTQRCKSLNHTVNVLAGGIRSLYTAMDIAESPSMHDHVLARRVGSAKCLIHLSDCMKECTRVADEWHDN